jgi:hypothetical protein
LVGTIIHAVDVHRAHDGRALDSNDADDAMVDEASKGSSHAARVGAHKRGNLDTRRDHNAHSAHREYNDQTVRGRTGHGLLENLVVYASAEQAETHQKQFLFPQQVDFLSTSVYFSSLLKAYNRLCMKEKKGHLSWENGLRPN